MRIASGWGGRIGLAIGMSLFPTVAADSPSAFSEARRSRKTTSLQSGGGARLMNGSLEIGGIPVLRERTQPLLRVILLFRIALDFDRTFGHHRGDGTDRSPYGEEQGSR